MSNEPREGELYVIAAPSGAGKTSLINSLLAEFDRLAFSVSDTTRAPRRGERDGEHYNFIDADTFRQRIDAGRYLEHAEVFGNYYGTDRAQVEALWCRNMDVLLEIDVQGAAQIRRSRPGACEIFILPPSLDVLKSRLVARGTDQPDVIARRLGEARTEISACLQFDWIVVNDDFDRAKTQLLSILRAWPLRKDRQARDQQNLIRELLV
ncbi:MAG: guanylate kinase [Wenzhouxiangellaceae bacterium]|nr:guanylate kinase [Wenzhouxiangellaceae bacterium]